MAYDRHLRNRELGESRRITTVMTTSNDEIFRAQEELGQNRLNEALTRLRVLRSRIEAETEPRLRGLHDRAGGLLDQIDRRMADELARDGDRARYQEFARKLNEALFYETQFTGLDQAASRKATEQSARAPWPCSPRRGQATLVPDRCPGLSAEKRRSRGCYTMLLVLAEAVERRAGATAARRGSRLAALTPASIWGTPRLPPVPARAGGRAGCGSPTAHHALDHFPRRCTGAGLDRRDPALRCRALTQARPLLVHCLSAICNLPAAARAAKAAQRLPQASRASPGSTCSAASRRSSFLNWRMWPSLSRVTRSVPRSRFSSRRPGRLRPGFDLLNEKPTITSVRALVNRGLVWLERRELDRPWPTFRPPSSSMEASIPPTSHWRKAHDRASRQAFDQFTAPSSAPRPGLALSRASGRRAGRRT
jgi:hypothetical protein